MIYLDNAATTKLCGEAFEAMLPYMREEYGNPSAVYTMAGRAKKAIENSRRAVAETLGAAPEEIFFTSGGTEADNWAIRAAAEGRKEKGRHLITTKVEHPAVLNTCRALEKQGFQVTYLDVDEYGRAAPGKLEAAIRPDTILISMMYANNEIGTIMPVGECAKIAAERGILFHTDAVQAYGQIPIDVRESGISMLSASAHKFHGPKGAGFLYVRKDAKISPLLFGGGQERGMRSGTENVAGIVGLGAAAKLSCKNREENAARQRRLRDEMTDRLLREIPGCILNGHPTKRLPGNISVCIPPLEGEAMLIQLDMRGICASSGSACATGDREPSHVLRAIGRTPEEARGSLRFTLSGETTAEEIDETAEAVKEIAKDLRRLMGWREDKTDESEKTDKTDKNR